MNPDISIITVTYNAAQTLPPTLDSIAAQTFRNFELLVIDGLSTDGTQRLAELFQKQHDDLQMTLVSKRDDGIYDAMNTGLMLAKGRYIVYLNAGDRLHASDTLATVAQQMKKGENNRFPAVIYGETDIVDADGKFLRHRRLQAPERLNWQSFKEGMLVCHQSFYALREIAPQYTTRFRYSSDFDWCVRVMLAAEEMGLALCNTHAILTDYLSEGQTTAHHKESLRERFQIMCHHYGRWTTCRQHAWFAIRQILKK